MEADFMDWRSDEIGYLLIDRQNASLFFQVVSRRYERGSIIITRTPPTRKK
jgi:DNA replication protein DnaC